MKEYYILLSTMLHAAILALYIWCMAYKHYTIELQKRYYIMYYMIIMSIPIIIIRTFIIMMLVWFIYRFYHIAMATS